MSASSERLKSERRKAKNRWTPVRRTVKGVAVYCSPACGHGCTRAEYEECRAHARELCARLGKGWKPDVWENVGWHYAARRGVVHIHGYHPTLGKPYYSLFFDSMPQLFVGQGKNPVYLLRQAITSVTTQIAQFQRQVGFVVGEGA